MLDFSALQGISAVTGCALGIMVPFGVQRREKIVARTEQIKLATYLLSQHNAAMELFLDDPAAPEFLKDLLLWFGDAINDETLAREIAETFSAPRDGAQHVSARASRVLEEIGNLEKHRADLAEAFFGALSSGLMAMYLRWDMTAARFERLVARTSFSPRQEVAIATKFADFERDNQRKRFNEPALEDACAA